MKKRGALELQFNWIFVLIVGVIIFLFFIVIVNKQREFTESRVSILIKKNIDTFVKASEVGAHSFKEISIPKTEITFACSERGVSFFEVGGFTEDTTTSIMFAPRTVNGDKLFFWTRDLEIPFRAASYLYITNEKVKYVFISEATGFVESLYNEFPEQLDKILVNQANVKDIVPQNYDYYVFIGKGADNTGLLSLNFHTQFRSFKGELLTISIKPSNNAVGEIRYAHGHAQNWESKAYPYLNRESVYGAIFSSSGTAYECNLRKAITKARLVANITYQRAINISEEYETDERCRYLYDGPLSELNKIQANANPDSMSVLNFKNIAGASGALIRANENFDRMPQCPRIY